jgi:hypothetical protein
MKDYLEAPYGPAEKIAFGETTLGPIFADFALKLWILLAGLDNVEDTVVLFCARGGFRLKLIYERFLKASNLTGPVTTCNLMVSRIVAVRVALIAGSPSAFEQIGYEMGTASLHEVVRAISGTEPTCADMSVLQRPYTKAGLVHFLASEEGIATRESIQHQTSLFLDHLNSCMRGRHYAILCDSGLSGSTMQLLKDGIPDINWRCALFARSNYKRFAAPHFRQTIGLAVEADCYSPLNTRTAVFRYWHLIEATLEPAAESVFLFERVNGIVRSNLEVDGWQHRILPAPDEFLAGVLRYIDNLPGSGPVAQIMKDVGSAYAALRRAFIWPTRRLVGVLDTGERSIDFGRTDRRSTLDKKSDMFRAVRDSLWREGAVLSAPRFIHRPFLAGIEAAYIVRWAMRVLRRGFSRRPLSDSHEKHCGRPYIIRALRRSGGI